MDENSISKVKSLLYDCTKDEVQTVIRQTENTDILYLYAYNYNWDNGFEIPQLILDNDKCDLSTALLIFFRAEENCTYLINRITKVYRNGLLSLKSYMIQSWERGIPKVQSDL